MGADRRRGVGVAGGQFADIEGRAAAQRDHGHARLGGIGRAFDRFEVGLALGVRDDGERTCRLAQGRLDLVPSLTDRGVAHV